MDYLLHHRVINWLKIARQMLVDSFDQELFVEEKRDARDLVTQMDRKIEAFFVDKIKMYYPNHHIIGEEGTVEANQTAQGIHWVIDPIDGTMNFIKQKNYFAIMIGIYQDGQPLAGYICNVVNDDLYYGIVGEGAYHNHLPIETIPVSSLQEGLISCNVMHMINNTFNFQLLANESLGVRYYGSAAIEIIGVLRGELAAYISAGIHPWDFAAGYAICKSMGYQVTTIEGKEPSIFERSTMIFANPSIHQQILDLLN